MGVGYRVSFWCSRADTLSVMAGLGLHFDALESGVALSRVVFAETCRQFQLNLETIGYVFVRQNVSQNSVEQEKVEKQEYFCRIFCWH